LRDIKTVVVLGANGTMGSQCAGIIAAFGGAKVIMVARNIDKAKVGLERAMEAVRSDVIRDRLTPATYEDLQRHIPESDWVLEMVAEDYQAKEAVNALISRYHKPGTLVSTVSSGLSIERLSKTFDEDGRKHYFGTHFYNPPYKMPLCELVSHSGSDPSIEKELEEYLHKKLLRSVVRTADTPAFAGNRVGFQLMNEVAQFAERYSNLGGIALMDHIMGTFTGRAMPPLVTVDMVGLDIHKAIVDNLYQNTNDEAKQTFVLPQFIQHLINLGKLGTKSGEGLYKTVRYADGRKERLVYDITSQTYIKIPELRLPFAAEAKRRIALADYRGVLRVICEDGSEEARLCRYFLARYLSYAFSIIGEVIDTRDCIDSVMGFGFNWAPPSAYVDLLGGVDRAVRLIESARLPVPPALTAAGTGTRFYRLQDCLDARSFFRVK